MKPKQLATLILTAASLFGFSQAAWACKKEVIDLQQALNSEANDGICSYQGDLKQGKKGKENCEGLNDKLDAVFNKLVEDEVAGAAWKIDDFGATLAMLAFSSEPMISVESYRTLMAPTFRDAEICVKNLNAVQSD